MVPSSCVEHSLACRPPDSQLTVIMYKASDEIFVFSFANFSLYNPLTVVIS